MAMTGAPLPIHWRAGNTNDSRDRAFTAVDKLGFIFESALLMERSGFPAPGTPEYEFCVTILSYGQAIYRKYDNVDESTQIILVGQLIAPNLDSMIQPDAMAEVLECFIGFWTRQNGCPFGKFSQALWTSLIREGGSLHHLADSLPQNIKDKVPATFAFHHVAAILHELYELRTANANSATLQAYVNLYVSLAKRGQISGEKARKITTEINENTQKEISVDPAVIDQLWVAISSKIEDNQFPQLFTACVNQVGSRNQRMKTTLQQSAGSGLTALTTIKMAIEKFPNFDWAKLNIYLSQEISAAEAAMKAVGENAYYGFKKDLGVVVSTKYRSLSWVAKELLVRYGGPEGVSLKNYKGWTKNPKHQAQLLEMIESYDPSPAIPMGYVEMNTPAILSLKDACKSASGLI